MGHTVQAFIAKAEVLRDAARGVAAAHVIPVGEGLALLLNTDEFYDEVGKSVGGDESLYREFYRLSSGLAGLGAEWSTHGPVAYIETDYWGGEGKQSALLWERGLVAYGPAKATLGPINDVLRRMGVERGDHHDEFDAVGLGRYRDNEDWIKQPRHGASA
jgi:hypothetical protein